MLLQILQDLEGPAPMVRLMQGDVGSGKTAVAFLALLAAVGSGWQGAMMAPTEVTPCQGHVHFCQHSHQASVLDCSCSWHKSAGACSDQTTINMSLVNRLEVYSDL